MSDISDDIPFEEEFLDDEEEDQYAAGPLSDGDKTLNERMTASAVEPSVNGSFKRAPINVDKLQSDSPSRSMKSVSFKDVQVKESEQIVIKP